VIDGEKMQQKRNETAQIYREIRTKSQKDGKTK